MTPRIDPEFQRLCRPLSEEETEKLRASLEAEGQRDLIVVWEGLILDGHNRFRLCTELGITPRFKDAPTHVEDRDAAKAWIILNQLGRRNLTPHEMSELRGRLYELEKVKGRSESTRNWHAARDQNDHEQSVSAVTAKRLAAQHGVGENTIRRDAAFAKGLDAIAGAVGERAAEEIRTGKSKIGKATVEKIGRSGNKDQVKAAYKAAKAKPRKAKINPNASETLMERARQKNDGDGVKRLRWSALQGASDRFGMAASDEPGDAEAFAQWAMENPDNRRFLNIMKGRLLWMSRFIRTVEAEMWQATEPSE